jgi:Ca-activated chloride channel family protein
MFRFEHPEFLWALAFLPVIIGFFIMMSRYRKRALLRFGDMALLGRLMPDFSKNKPVIKFSLLMISMIFLIIAWANPQWGTKKQKVKRESVDVFIALDVSKSMLAQDISPNRMERAKRFVGDMTDALKGNRIGSIVFAGNAYMQMPLTTDYSAAKLFAKSASTRMAPSQGTAISEAIDLTMETFGRDSKYQKALIIVTDGEDHEEEAMEKASEALADGIVIYTVGIGTAAGGNIPIFQNGVAEFKKDEAGNIVTTKLNEGMLRDVAKAGGGNYFNLNNNDRKVIAEIKQRVEQLDKRVFEQRVFEEYDSYFQYFLFVGLLFLVGEFLLDFKKNKFLESNKILGD